MNKLFTIFSFLLLATCNHPSDKNSDSQDEAKTKALSEIKVPVYAWMGGPDAQATMRSKPPYSPVQTPLPGKSCDRNGTNGAAGVCLFTPGRMTDEHWKVFETAIRKDFTK